MKLRAVGAEASASLAQLHARGFGRPWTSAAIVELLASPGVVVLGAEDEGRLAGFVMLRTVADEAEILTLVVDPPARRAGIARALVEAAAATAAATGGATLWIEVATDNIAAIALYLGSGFARAGVRRGYYRQGDATVDALVLKRPLNTVTACAYSAATDRSRA